MDYQTVKIVFVIIRVGIGLLRELDNYDLEAVERYVDESIFLDYILEYIQY